MKRVWYYVVTMWQPAGGYLAGLVLVASILLFRLGSLVPVLPSEVFNRIGSSSIQTIVSNPVNAPYKTLRFATYTLHNSIASERLPSALIAGVSVLLFYYLARRLSSKKAAILGSLLYATSSTLLSTGRIATPNISVIVLLALLSAGTALRFNKRRIRSWFVGTVVVATALYVPGMLYFIPIGIAIGLRHIRKEKLFPKPLILGICGSIFIIILIPLLMGLVSSPTIWREYLGLPATMPSVLEFLKNLAAVPIGILLKAPINPEYRLGELPMLDALTAVLFLLGCIVTVRQYRLDRLYIFAGIFVLGSVFTAVSGNYENSLVVLPIVYLFITIGLNYLLSTWKATFPLNPLARAVSLCVLSLAVLISCNFQARRYFIAWPNNPTIRSVFIKT